MSLDGGYSSNKNRKSIFNLGMKPNIPENKRNRKKAKRGRKQIFDAKIFKERFRTIERVFAWEDKFKRLLLRFEIESIHHYAMKTIAYSMINLRHFCEQREIRKQMEIFDNDKAMLKIYNGTHKLDNKINKMRYNFKTKQRRLYV